MSGSYYDHGAGVVPPMVPVDARTERWMAEHHDPAWEQHVAEAFA